MIDRLLLAKRVVVVEHPTFWTEIDGGFSAVIVRLRKGEEGEPSTVTLIIGSEDPRSGTVVVDQWNGKRSHVVDIVNGTLTIPNGLIITQLQLAVGGYKLDLDIKAVRSRFDLNKRLYL